MNIFVASATEVAAIATAIKTNLEESCGAQATAWPTQFGPGRTPVLDNLLRAMETAEFGIFVLAPTDITRMPSDTKETATPRDNVLFELGLFVGLRGRDHVYLVYPELPEDAEHAFWIPSDFRQQLHGAAIPWHRVATILDTRTKGQDWESDLKNVLATVCNSAMARFNDVSNQARRVPIDRDFRGLPASMWSR